jgi:Domain of unknown function (DUF6268)
MRKSLIFSLFLSPLLLLSTRAGDGVDGAKVEKTGAPIAQEFNFNYSYVGGADMKQGNAKLGSMDENSGLLNYVVSPEIREGLLFRGGVEMERYSFGLPDAAPLPNTLQAVSAIIGIDMQVADSLLMRVEVQPGIYGAYSNIKSDAFNAPAIIGGSYLMNKDIQWFFGISINIDRQYPVLPGAGVRWKFADDWTLYFLLPKPRLEYDINKKLQVYLGADFLGGTFQTSDDFGNSHGKGHQNLNGTPVDYTEFRFGPGVSWKVLPAITVEGEIGCMAYRDFNFYRAHTDMHNNEPAPYAQLAVHGNF